MNWTKEFDKTMNHTYMVISKNSFFENDYEADYRIPMLMQNKIPGLLSLNQQMLNGENKLYYEISSLISMEDAFKKDEMDYKSVRELLIGCINIYSNIEEYLLDGKQIILTPEYIYINPETRKPLFTLYPDYEKDSRDAFVELVEYILEKLDHKDQETVMLGYKVYRATRNPNFTMKEIENVLLDINKLDSSTEQLENKKVKYEFEFEEENNDTVLLTPSAKENFKEKINIKNNLDNKIQEIKKVTSISEKKLPGEVLGMVSCALVLCVLTVYLLLNESRGFADISNQTMMYLLGGIAMSFMSLLIFGYSYAKKKKVPAK